MTITHATNRLMAVLHDRDDGTRRVVEILIRRRGLTEADIEWARECATGPGVVSPTAVAVAELRKRGQAKDSLLKVREFLHDMVL